MKNKLYFVWTWIISQVFLRTRFARRCELSRLIGVLHSNNCEHADRVLERCCHLAFHYRISLSEAKFTGTLDDLCMEAYKSFGRYVDSYRQWIDETWPLEGDPDELGIVVPPVAEGWDRFASDHLYAKACRRLKRLERRRQSFLFYARATVARVSFFLRTSGVFCIVSS